MLDRVRGSGPRLADGLLLGLLAAGLFVVLGKMALGTTAEPWAQAPSSVWTLVLEALIPWARESGRTMREVAPMASAVVATLGVLLTHAAAWPLLRSRGSAWLLTALVVVSPPVLAAATSPGAGAAHFTTSQLAFLIAVHMARRPTKALAVALGVACAVAFVAFGAGLLLPLLAAPWVLASRLDAGAPRARYVRRLVALAIGVHLTIAIAWWSVRGTAQVWPAGIVPGPVQMLEAVLEWGRSHAPLSLLAIAAALYSTAGNRGPAFGLGLLVLAIASAAMVDSEDRAACLIPLVMPAAVLVEEVADRRLLVAMLAVTLGLGAAHVVSGR